MIFISRDLLLFFLNHFFNGYNQNTFGTHHFQFINPSCEIVVVYHRMNTTQPLSAKGRILGDRILGSNSMILGSASLGAFKQNIFFPCPFVCLLRNSSLSSKSVLVGERFLLAMSTASLFRMASTFQSVHQKSASGTHNIEKCRRPDNSLAISTLPLISSFYINPFHAGNLDNIRG